MSAVAEQKDFSGVNLAGFRIKTELGRGNNGVVYLARQLALDREVALKILLPELAAEPGYVQSFLHEARLAARLDHPNIVQALDAGEAPGGIYFFAMEYVPGTTLEEIRIHQPERISLRFILDVSIQLADALDYAWNSHRMIHGDIKPGNLLIREGDGVVKLADLGLARVSGSANSGEIMATPMYVAPEVIEARQEKIGVVSDIYSFAVMLYELAAGTAPFHGDTETLLHLHLETPPEPLLHSNPDLDPEFALFIDRMLEKDPDRRPQSWFEVRQFLERTRARLCPGNDSGTPLRRSPGQVRVLRPRWWEGVLRHPFQKLLILLLLLLFVGMVALLLYITVLAFQ